MITLTEKQIKRFWEKVDIRSREDCWEWKGMKSKNGNYGNVKIQGKNYRSHRVSYLITYGSFREELFVCHKCDNPPCVNPNHLFLGTPKDNTQDMIKKGRAARKLKGKIRVQDALEIRRLRAEENKSLNELANQFDLHHDHINAICRGRVWQDLTRSCPYINKLEGKPATHKITPEVVLKIRELRNDKNLPIKQVTEMLGVTDSIVIDVSLGNSWSEIGGAIRDRDNYKGEGRRNSKLSEEKVRQIRQLKLEGASLKEICKRFDVSPALASEVVNYKRWKHVS